MSSANASRSGFRPEIQGLRAVGALLVAIYHIWLGRVSGGVDVFFVVSGFLITTSLLKQVERTGRVSLGKFWGGLARRLLPTAMLVLFAVTIASVFWLPRTLWDITIQQVLACILYFENWQLAFSAVDYLSQGQSASPVQHYWALSIQGQFYLLWPFVVGAAVLAARRFGASFPTTAACLFGALFMVSLAFSVIATRNDQAFTYFNTFARIWEFCAGAFLALAPAVALPRSVRVIFGWTGLAGIVACGLIFQVSRVFPGYAALWPIGCAVLIMLAGTSGSRFGADRLLACRPLVYLGGISYALYLWHWPLLVFYRWFAGHTDMNLVEGSIILIVSLALAAVSTRIVENPLRFATVESGKPWRLAAFVAACSSPVLIVGVAWAGFHIEQKQYDERTIAASHPDYPGALALEEGFTYQGAADVPIYPGMLAVQDDVAELYRDGCYKPDADWQRDNCVYGDHQAKRTIALVGGSHSAHWLPALDRVAKQQGWRVTVYTKHNCLFSAPIGEMIQDKWCQQFNNRTLEILLEDRPEVVFTTSTRGSGTDEYVPQGYLYQWSRLGSAGINVVAVRDTPWMKFWVPECLEIKGHDSAGCAQATRNMLSRTSPAETLSERPANVQFIDMSEYFCNEQECPPVIGNVIVYRDDSHITAAYARTLAPMLGRKLASVLPGDGYT